MERQIEFCDFTTRSISRFRGDALSHFWRCTNLCLRRPGCLLSFVLTWYRSARCWLNQVFLHPMTEARCLKFEHASIYSATGVERERRWKKKAEGKGHCFLRRS